MILNGKNRGRDKTIKLIKIIPDAMEANTVRGQSIKNKITLATKQDKMTIVGDFANEEKIRFDT